MPAHDVTMNLSHPITVKNVDVEFEVRSDGELIGKFRSAEAVSTGHRSSLIRAHQPGSSSPPGWRERLSSAETPGATRTGPTCRRESSSTVILPPQFGLA